MAKAFRRHFSEAGLQALKAKPGWWTDLLAYRFHDYYGNEQPIVIAVRGDYLNAYVEGQSILKIKYDVRFKPAVLRGKIHCKYILDGNYIQEVSKSPYLSFNGITVTNDDNEIIEEYAGKVTLDRWVMRARIYARLKSGSISEKVTAQPAHNG